MHEMSLCEGMLQIIEEQAERQGFERVKRVRLEIGELAGVEFSSLRLAFEVIQRGTLAEGAGLEIVELPGRAHCPGCGGEVHIGQRFAVCPECGHSPLQICGGDEMRIKELEVV